MVGRATRYLKGKKQQSRSVRLRIYGHDDAIWKLWIALRFLQRGQGVFD